MDIKTHHRIRANDTDDLSVTAFQAKSALRRWCAQRIYPMLNSLDDFTIRSLSPRLSIDM
jgi:hypothetical protein